MSQSQDHDDDQKQSQTESNQNKETKETTDNKRASSELQKYVVDGIVPVVENGDVLPHFGNKPRGKYIKHNELSKEEIIQLRREQNREAARRMRRKKAQQRAFLEEQIDQINSEIVSETDEKKKSEFKSKLDELQKSRQEVIAIQNRSSKNKRKKRNRSNSNPDVLKSPQKKRKLVTHSESETSDNVSSGYSPQIHSLNNTSPPHNRTIQLIHPQFQVIQPIANINQAPIGLQRNNFNPPPTLVIKQNGSPQSKDKNKNNRSQSARGSGLVAPTLLQPMVTPLKMAPSPLFTLQPQLMNSPQMFSYHSPQSLGNNRWLVSPFKSQFHGTQISPNMNMICTPLKQQFGPNTLSMNHNDNKDEHPKVKSEMNIDAEADEKEEITTEDHSVGTSQIEYKEIGINTECIKNHKCDICDKSLICPQHLLEYHKQQKLECFQCDEVFDNPEVLRFHIKQKHKNVLCNLSSVFGVKF